MINKCSEKDINRILAYIGNDYGRCLYMYIDIKKYGVDKDFFSVWTWENETGDIRALVSKYHSGMQLFSRTDDFDVYEIKELIDRFNPSMVVGMDETLEKIRPILPGYDEEYGLVGKLAGLQIAPGAEAYSARDEEIKGIVDLISEDEALGGPYEYEELMDQYTERRKEKFGRNYIQRDNDNRLIGHAATYAETEEIAVISGVITAPAYRGCGYSKGILAALCDALLKEGKDVFSYYYIPAAKKMHEGIGFETIGKWTKLIRVK